MPIPSETLAGMKLPGGWTVDSIVKPKPTGTGGSFSVGYLVHNDDGRLGFLKAIDYSSAFGAPTFVDQVKIIADSYIFERDICLKCRDTRVSRVVHAIDHGEVNANVLGPLPLVHYLIFERADGDVRGVLDATADFDVAFAMRTLHGIAVALKQLHNAGIAHQDVKPSNVLVFAQSGSKLADLGRAWAEGIPAPHDRFRFAGDPNYVPLELVYGVAIEEHSRRFGYDLYLLGSLVVFLFTRVNFNALLMKHVDAGYRNHRLVFADVLPYFQGAFPSAIMELSTHVPEVLRDHVVEIVKELCDPDHRNRGNPVATSQQRFSLERYISAFDLLTKRANYHLGK